MQPQQQYSGLPPLLPVPSHSPSHASFSASPSGPTTYTSSSTSSSSPRVVPKRMAELVASVDPQLKLEPDVETYLIDLADAFVDSVISNACLLAKHRGSKTLDAKDIAFHLEEAWQLRVPGYLTAPPSAFDPTINPNLNNNPSSTSNTPTSSKYSGGIPSITAIPPVRKARITEGHKLKLAAVAKAKMSSSEEELNDGKNAKRKREEGSYQ